MTTSVTEANLRQNTFKTLYEFIDDNKSSSFSLFSAFPQTSSFPCIVVNPANISYSRLTMNLSTRKPEISVVIDFYDYAKNGKTSIDSEKDKIAAALHATAGSFMDNRGVIFRYLEDEPSDEFVEGKTKINYGGFRAYFYLN